MKSLTNISSLIRKVTLSLSEMPRQKKQILMVMVDAFIMLIGFWVAYGLRLSLPQVIFNHKIWMNILITITITEIVFIRLKLYKMVIEYSGEKMIKTIIIGSIISFCILVVSSIFIEVLLPRSVAFTYFLSNIFLLNSIRYLAKVILYTEVNNEAEPVIVFGSSSTGKKVINSFKGSPSYYIVAIIDKDNFGTIIDGIPIIKENDIEEFINRYDVKKILLAVPNLSRKQKLELIKNLEAYCEVFYIPELSEIIAGNITLSDLKPIKIEDILGREPVQPISVLFEEVLKKKVIMVTGAGGSIGSELCRQVAKCNPEKLLLIENDEYRLYTIHQEIESLINNSLISLKVYPILCSVRNQYRINKILKKFSVDIIYHAAAYKHVPLVEYNVSQGILNNVQGTLTMVDAAQENQVKRFVLVSTDKAVRPTNIMGASKRLAELIVQAYADNSINTIFSMVRFGNVLGSSGSVIPKFKQQIDRLEDISVTHKDITRYFMTIPEASQLVIQAGSLAIGGEVFILDMGEPVRIYDLAVNMIKLSGLTLKTTDNPNGDIGINIVGLRPGEKLFEELLLSQHNLPTEHPLIYKANEVKINKIDLEEVLSRLFIAAESESVECIFEILNNCSINFKHNMVNVDLISN